MALQPTQTGHQQIVQAQREMLGMHAPAEAYRVVLAGLSAEHARAAGRIDTTMANFTGAMRDLGETTAQSANSAATSSRR